MKLFKIYALVVLLVMIIVPSLALITYPKKQPKLPETDNAVFSMPVTVYRTATNTVQTLSCYDYICSVVAGEMPADYHSEALRAQCVAAFTYMINKMNYVKENPDADIGHNGAYMCDDYSHCKAFLEKKSAREKWGNDWFNKYYRSIESAVTDTLGQMITYGDMPVNAVFHAISNGTTCSAKEVWGTDVPYLQSVDCESDKTASDYQSKLTLSHSDFKNVFKTELGVTLSDDYENWLGKLTREDSGMTKEIVICDTAYSGTHIRKMFGLRSATFDVKITDKEVVFTVYGYGHGVGMSQNGANEMAKSGMDYKQILAHFYSGTKIQTYTV